MSEVNTFLITLIEYKPFDQVNKSLRLTANAIQNYSFDKNDKIPDMPDEKDSGISQVKLHLTLVPTNAGF